MSRITLNSSNSAVLVGDSPAFKTNNEIGTLLAGVQNISFSMPQTRQVQKQIGSCYYAVDDLVRHPDIDLNIDYLFSPTMANEDAIGLNVTPYFEPNINPPTQEGDFISGLENKSYNFYIYNHPNQNFSATKYLQEASSNPPNNGEIISFGNAYLTSYNISFSEGSLPTASAAFKCCNMQAEIYDADVLSPAINLASGNNDNVGNLDVSQTKTEKADFYGPGVNLDLVDIVTSAPGDVVIELENLQIGGQKIDADNHVINSLSIDIPIERADLHGLGSDYVRDRKMQLPSRGVMNISSLVESYQEGFVSGLLNNESIYDFNIRVKSCEGGVYCDFIFDQIKLESFNYNLTVNDDMQYSASFSFYMDNK